MSDVLYSAMYHCRKGLFKRQKSVLEVDCIYYDDFIKLGLESFIFGWYKKKQGCCKLTEI